jgi:hypothetical protein
LAWLPNTPGGGTARAHGLGGHQGSLGISNNSFCVKRIQYDTYLPTLAATRRHSCTGTGQGRVYMAEGTCGVKRVWRALGRTRAAALGELAALVVEVLGDRDGAHHGPRLRPGGGGERGKESERETERVAKRDGEFGREGRLTGWVQGRRAGAAGCARQRTRAAGGRVRWFVGADRARACRRGGAGRTSPVPMSVAGKMTVWKGTLSLPMNCTSSTSCIKARAKDRIRPA